MKKGAVKRPSKILCYVDLSKSSAHLVEYAHNLAESLGAELHLLHTVADIGKAAGFYVPHINTDKLEEEMISAAQDKLYAFSSKMADMKPEQRIVRRGDQLEAIMDEINTKGFELLVIGHQVASFSIFKSDYGLKFLKNPLCPVLIYPIKGE